VLEGEITARIGAVHERYDVLLCPAMGIPALQAGVDYSNVLVEIDGKGWEPMHDLCLTEVFNPAGRCPVVTVPAGRDGHGVPIGVQVVGRTYDDATAINVARAIELARPWPLVSEAWRDA